MARGVAGKWLERRAKVEYRFQILASPQYFGGILRSFRDGRIKLSKVEPLPDLGVSEMSDGVQVWSSNLESLRTLDKFFSRQNIETSWIW